VPPNVDGLRFLVGAALLIYASVSDLRTRRVSNHVWLIGSGIGVALFAYDLFVTGRAEWIHVGVAAAIIVLSYGFWYVHLIAGGADAKALMMLATLIPIPIDLDVAARHFPIWDSSLPPTFVVFANSLVAFVALPLGLFAYNVARGHVRFPAMFLGYKRDLDEASRSFVWIMERAEGEKTRMVLFASKMSPDEQQENVDRLRAMGVKRVWVTPKIPFMVPLLGGFLVAFALGDLFTHYLLEPFVRAR
jgi:preflagellin peptidase FlaK